MSSLDFALNLQTMSLICSLNAALLLSMYCLFAWLKKKDYSRISGIDFANKRPLQRCCLIINIVNGLQSKFT